MMLQEKGARKKEAGKMTNQKHQSPDNLKLRDRIQIAYIRALAFILIPGKENRERVLSINGNNALCRLGK